MSIEFQPRSLIPDVTVSLFGAGKQFWDVHVFDEGAYRSWTLFPGKTLLCVAYGVLWRNKFEVIEQRVKAGIPRVTEDLLRHVERCVRVS